MGKAAGWIGGAALAGALCACTPHERVPDLARARADPPGGASPPAGGPLQTGATTASMARQYAHPVFGPTPAAGASAWVRPALAPAFAISTPLPPGDPPPPPPAAVANRQPNPPPAEPVRPKAAVPDEPAPVPAATVDAGAGRRLFVDQACGACHILADAGGAGAVGPSLDRNPRLTLAYAIDVIANGSGAMPAFSGQMTDAEIPTLAAYVVQASRK